MQFQGQLILSCLMEKLPGIFSKNKSERKIEGKKKKKSRNISKTLACEKKNSRKMIRHRESVILREGKEKKEILQESSYDEAARFLESSRILGALPKRVCISCFISALRPITSFVRWHLHVNGKSALARSLAHAGIRRPRAGINQKGNLKKGLQPARGA